VYQISVPGQRAGQLIVVQPPALFLRASTGHWIEDGIPNPTSGTPHESLCRGTFGDVGNHQVSGATHIGHFTLAVGSIASAFPASIHRLASSGSMGDSAKKTLCEL
jgi:hypothetical protein